MTRGGFNNLIVAQDESEIIIQKPPTQCIQTEAHNLYGPVWSTTAGFYTLPLWFMVHLVVKLQTTGTCGLWPGCA